ncbi:MAG: sortase [Thermoanaerobaculia bacterium]
MAGLSCGLLLTGRAAYLKGKGLLARSLIQRAWALRDAGLGGPPWRGADFLPVARLVIPERGYDEVVLEGAAPRTLAFGPARLLSSAFFGEPGNIVLAGHRTSWFRPLEHVRRGDLVILEWRARGDATGTLHRSRYRVQALSVVDAHDTRALGDTLDDRLTLVTCFPFGPNPGSPSRYVVLARPDAPVHSARGR